MRDKLALTQAIISQLPPDDRPGIRSAMRDWWQNTRPGAGMRLTPAGHAVMQQLAIESYRFDIQPDQVVPRLLIQLDQRLQDPYFLKADRRRPWIEFYGSREALLANLYGDLSRFLENYR